MAEAVAEAEAAIMVGVVEAMAKALVVEALQYLLQEVLQHVLMGAQVILLALEEPKPVLPLAAVHAAAVELEELSSFLIRVLVQ